jgi:hypothetical protein
MAAGIVMGVTLSDRPHHEEKRNLSSGVRNNGGNRARTVADFPLTAGSASLNAAAPPLPVEVAMQFADSNFLDRARTLWVPAEFVDLYQWKLGFFDEGKWLLSPQARQILELGDTEAARVEAAIDRFVAAIREIEQRHAVVLEKTSKTLAIRIPAGLTPNGPQQQFEADLLPLLHNVKFRTLYVQLMRYLKQSSAVISGKQMDIRAMLEEETLVRVETQIENHKSNSSSMPPEHAYLLPAVIGTGAARRWQ